LLDDYFEADFGLTVAPPEIVAATNAFGLAIASPWPPFASEDDEGFKKTDLPVENATHFRRSAGRIQTGRRKRRIAYTSRRLLN
jgi:hypothetical protein